MPIYYGQVKGRKRTAVQPVYKAPESGPEPARLPDLDRTRRHPMRVDGVEYANLSEACAAMGTTTARFRAATQDAKSGEWRHKSGRVYRWERLDPVPKGAGAARPVRILGMDFGSKAEAVRTLRISKETLRKALESGTFRGMEAKEL